jgi:hypothetical protein
VVVALSLVFALLVQSSLFTYSEWMLGDMAYHRGVAYTMQAGFIQGEGPFRGLLTYYGGLHPLLVGVLGITFDVTFDAIVSVVSWIGGPAWVMCAWLAGRRMWPSDRPTVSAFVVLSTFAVPFSADRTITGDIWTSSILAAGHAYWPIYPRDVALILTLLLAAALLDPNRTRRVILSGVLIGAMVSVHLELGPLAGVLVAAVLGWRAIRDHERAHLLDIALVGAISILVSAWWWVPRAQAILAGGGLIISDYPLNVPLRLDLPRYLTSMGVVGVLSLIGFALLFSRPFRGPTASLVLVWAATLLFLIPFDRIAPELDPVNERRLWLVFSIPATAAAAVAMAQIARVIPRGVSAALVIAAVLSMVPGTKATLESVNASWRAEGFAGRMAYEPQVWGPLWDQLHDEVVAERGLLVATYDTYAVWTWSFTGAQQVSVWLPGPVKLGFDPEVLTGLGYLERHELTRRAFQGRSAMCNVLPPAGATKLLLDRMDGLVATYDVTPASQFRVDARDRDLESIDREVAPNVRYQDGGGFDQLLLQPGGTFAVDWVNPDIRAIVIVAQLPGGNEPALEARVGQDVVSFTAERTAPTRYVISTPDGVGDGILISASRGLRLFRVSGYTTVPGMEGPDGPFIVPTQEFCQ